MDLLLFNKDHQEIRDREYKTIFGNPEIIHPSFQASFFVSINVYKPTPKRNFWTYVTDGFSEHVMDSRSDLQRKRIEFYMLCTDEPTLGGENKNYDPLAYKLIQLANVIFVNKIHLGGRDYIPTPEPIVPGSKLTSFLLFESNEPEKNLVYTDNEDSLPVTFTHVDFISPQEAQLLEKDGMESLISLFIKKNKLRESSVFRESFL